MFDNSPPKQFFSSPSSEAATSTEGVKESRNESKEEIDSIRHKKRAVLGYPLLKRMSSEQLFDENHINITKDNKTVAEGSISSHLSDKGLAITRKTLHRLRIHILANRKLCFAGKVPRGVLMPKNYWLQYLIIKRLIVWYFPCIRFDGISYHLNDKCFKRRERKFLEMFFKTRKLFLDSQDH